MGSREGNVLMHIENRQKNLMTKVVRDTLIRQSAVWVPRSLLKIQTWSKRTSGFLGARKRQQRGECVLCWCAVQQRSAAAQRSQLAGKRNTEWMKGRAPERGEGCRAQWSEWKGYRRRAWKEMCSWSESEGCWTLDWLWVYLTWKGKTGTGLLNSSQLGKSLLVVTQRGAVQPWSWKAGSTCSPPQQFISKRIILFQALPACDLLILTGLESWNGLG